MTQLRIDEVTPSKSGKAWRVKSGDKWYGASKDILTLQDKGRTASVEIKTTDYGPWLETVKFADPEPSRQAPGPSQPTSAPYWLPFASNTIAHAISAGLIKDETMLKVWMLACKEAAQKANDGDVGF